tara:strand:+ start:250 stop:1356 length:1107 start_codon:yes stop_codon:yes gene_type:complete
MHHFIYKKELNELYISTGIRAFALALVGIFIPIYLINIGYTIPNVLFFFALISLIIVMVMPLVSKFVSYVGIKHSMLYSIPLMIIGYLLLYTLEQYAWPLWLLAIFFGVSNAIYWFAYHLDFSKFSDFKKRGSEVGRARIVTSVFLILGPAVGGFLLTFVGFKAVFIISAIILALSTLPLFASKDVHEPVNFSLKGLFKGQSFKDFLAFFGLGVESGIGLIIWPIFIFFTIMNSFHSMGLVFTLSLFFSTILIFVVGRLADMHRIIMLRVGAVLNSLVWLIKLLVKTPLQVFVADSFYGASKTVALVPYEAVSYDKANKSKDLVKYTLFRESSIHFGRIVVLLVMMPIADLTVGFWIGAGASLLYFFF